jgi:hypothetical protein
MLYSDVVLGGSLPTEYALEPAQRLVRSRAWGILTDAESLEHYRRIAADPAFQPSFRQLCDLRGVTQIEAASKTLRDLASSSIFAPDARRAFVAQTDEHFGLARMLQAFCESEGAEVGVFRTLAEAEAWLQLLPSAP